MADQTKVSYSLNRRLILSLAASLALFFLVQILIIGHQVRYLTENNIQSRLEHDQKQLLAALTWQPPAAPSLNAAAIPRIYQRPFSGHYYQVNVGGHLLRSRSLWDEQLPEQSGNVGYEVPGPDHQQLLMVSQRFILNEQPAEIRVAEDISVIEKNTSDFQESLFLFAGAGLILLLILQGSIVHYGLAPLQRVREQLRQLEKGEIEQVTILAPREIQPLVEEVNRLLQLLRNRLMRSRNALGDLAHALKTPLSIMGQVVERHPDDEDKSNLQNQLKQIQQRIHAELARARTAGRTPGGYWMEPHRDLNDLMQMLRQVFPAISMKLYFPEEINVAADREDMLELFGNLLENAGKWAVAEVRCSIVQQGKLLEVTIEDDGPGVAESEMVALLERGRRADESKPGYGLGLAIVNDIIEAYDGELSLGKSADLKGLLVTMKIPQP